MSNTELATTSTTDLQPRRRLLGFLGFMLGLLWIAVPWQAHWYRRPALELWRKRSEGAMGIAGTVTALMVVVQSFIAIPATLSIFAALIFFWQMYNALVIKLLILPKKDRMAE